MRNFDVLGNTSPASRLTIIKLKPNASRERWAHNRPLVSCQTSELLIFGFF